MSPPNDDPTLPPQDAPPTRTADFTPAGDAPTVGPSVTRGGPAGVPAVPGYEIVGELGRGGMGVVYHAVQTRLHRPVALKMVLAADHADPRDLVRFLAEAEAVAAVKHPHVVQVYEFGEAGGRPFFAMEFLPGGSLAGRLKGGPIAPTAAAELVRKLALGVQAAHDLGIVHRDLKPANVLFDADGEPKVTDFGLAKRGGRHDLTKTGAVMGTPAYMAPEQAAGRTKFVGPAADVYALGVILFECLTGRVPFEADDTVGLLMMVASDDPPSVREFAPDVPRELEAVCLKCLAKEPVARYLSAAELAADLQRFLDGDPPAAARSSFLGTVWATLGRGRHAAEFASYAGIFLWMAPVVFLAEVVITAAVNGLLPDPLIPATQYARAGAILFIVWRFRRGRLLPRTPTERMLWSLWGGYIVTCFVTGISLRMVYGWAGPVEVQLYQPLALLTALAFFALGASFWGWFYAFGLVFLVLAPVMALDLSVAPLEFGAMWAVVLVVFARYLRRLARAADPPQPAGQPGG